MSKVNNSKVKSKQPLFALYLSGSIILLLVLIEVLLRIFNYGINTSVFIRHSQLKDYYVTNPFFFNKYFPAARKDIQEQSRSMFKVKKDPALKRGFILGGSTAEGFPFNSNHGFGKISEEALKASGENFEIINAGFTGMSSYSVKDISGKLLKYQPDFLIIYSGHDEYYGTIGAAQGGGPFIKNLSMILKEIKICQFIMNRLDFSDKKISEDPKKDAKIADEFLTNIKAVVDLYKQSNIPVIIIDPVSNLYDMPPFSGDNDEELKSFILEYFTASRAGDLNKLKELYSGRGSDNRFQNNANIIYLDAISKYILKSNPSINDFIQAKDKDRIPLRSRSILNEKLKAYCTGSSKPSNLHYMPLKDFLTSKFGDSILSNLIFIDHVHFNRVGQIFMGRITADLIGEILMIDDSKKEKINQFFMDFYQIDKINYYLPFYETTAYLNLEKQLKEVPFSEMTIPYAAKPMGKNEISEDIQLFNMIEKKPENGFLPMLEYYSSILNNYPKAGAYLESFEYLYPSNPYGYLNYANYYLMLNDEKEMANQLKKAWILSGKDKRIRELIKDFLKTKNKGEYTDKIFG